MNMKQLNKLQKKTPYKLKKFNSKTKIKLNIELKALKAGRLV